MKICLFKYFQIKKISFLFLFFFISYFGSAQNSYEKLKELYYQLRKDEKNDSALLLAKKINAWAFQNESDTSLNYAFGLS